MTTTLEERANVIVDIEYSPDKGTKFKFPVYEKKDWAAGYDVIIHDECSADVTDKAFVENIITAHEGGVPAVNLHCAMHSYRWGNFKKPVEAGADNARWYEMLGLQTTGHGPQKPIELTILEKDHPITKGMEGWTTENEELYNNIQIMPTAKPLMRGKQDAGDKEGSNNCVTTWVNEFGAKKTRIFSTTLGHNNSTVSDDRFLNLVTRGLLWATDKLDAEGKAKAGYGPAKAAAAVPAATKEPEETNSDFPDAGDFPRESPASFFGVSSNCVHRRNEDELAEPRPKRLILPPHD
jgi:type 1 glutamine amidotransferase